ncbi:MAG: hypothetical protein IJS47_06490 [Clostridia bacterium]|nr:hypothetical protein [Clostridia bacterium]
MKRKPSSENEIIAEVIHTLEKKFQEQITLRKGYEELSALIGKAIRHARKVGDDNFAAYLIARREQINREVPKEGRIGCSNAFGPECINILDAKAEENQSLRLAIMGIDCLVAQCIFHARERHDNYADYLSEQREKTTKKIPRKIF